MTTAVRHGLSGVRPYQLCVRCVMDTSDPLIRFDTAGICIHCTDFLASRIGVVTAPKPELNEIFRKIRQAGRGRDFDCVVGVSGGVDSSYVTMLAADHHLRVLAVHLDNGWNTKLAVDNIRNLVSHSRCSYATYVLPWTEFRRVQIAFLRSSVPEVDTPTDVAIQRALHHHARRNGVKYILSGGNIASEGILPTAWHYNARDTRYSHAILDAGGCPRSAFRSQRFGAMQEAYHRVVSGIQTIYPLNYMKFDKIKFLAELEHRFNWQDYGGKHNESRFTRWVQRFYLFVKHGIDYRRATLSSELLMGGTTRKAALTQLSISPIASFNAVDETAYVAKKLGLSPAEFEEIMSAAPKWFFDYPTNQAQLDIIYSLYRRATGRTKTSNF